MISALAFVQARAADHTALAGLFTAATAAVGYATRINPLWLFTAGGLLGLTGWL